jgi:hypothetical protein
VLVLAQKNIGWHGTLPIFRPHYGLIPPKVCLPAVANRTSLADSPKIVVGESPLT